MFVLVACESSGVVREAFRAIGHDAWSCDLFPAQDGSRHHFTGDALAVANGWPWDLMIAHPPCTFLCNSGAKWLYRGGRKENGKDPERWRELDTAAQFFLALLSANVHRKAIENPVMHEHAAELIGSRATQFIQPWQHGHKEMKATGLHLVNLPPLLPTSVVGPPPTDKAERRKWAKVHQASPGPDRWRERSRTLPGIAKAFAQQWG